MWTRPVPKGWRAVRGCNCGTVHKDAHAPGCSGFAVEYHRLIAELDAERAKVARLEAELHGHEVFVGPCVHGKDPWYRCGECEDGTALDATVLVIQKLEADNARLREALEVTVRQGDIVGADSQNEVFMLRHYMRVAWLAARAALATDGGT